VQLGVGVGVHTDFKEGDEDVLQQLLEVLDDALGLVDVVQPRNLHQYWGVWPINFIDGLN